MKELIESINEIVKYGLESNISELEKVQNLEKNLIIFYKLFEFFHRIIFVHSVRVTFCRYVYIPIRFNFLKNVCIASINNGHINVKNR